MMSNRTQWFTAALTLAVASTVFAEKVDFAKQIVPILRENCYKCHGPDKDKGDLRLHTKKHITNEDYTVMAKDPVGSELYFRVTLPPDDADVMPPKGDPLTKQQQELIKQWINEGADFGDWVEDHEASAGKPQREVYPEVPKADPQAMSKLESIGALAMPLARDTNVINVDFRAAADSIGDSHLVHLKPVAEQVVWLNLAETKITDDGLAVLAELKNLRRLHLEKTGITDKALQHIAKLPDLQYLNIYGTNVTDAGLLQLAQMKKLEKLYLWQTKTTDNGVKALAGALPDVRIDTGYKPPKPEEKPAEQKKDDKADDKNAKKPQPKPDSAFAKLADKFKAGSCCDKALKAGKDQCGHPCCVEALKKNEVCKKCNG